MIELFFNVGAGSRVFIGSGAAVKAAPEAKKLVPGSRAAVVTERGVPEAHVKLVTASLGEAGFSVSVLVLEGGESSKTLSSVEEVYRFLRSMEVTRSDAVVSLGGGVTGDIAGFAAATYLRGVGHISFPTTVIAQTDSAYGGKTGVDFMGVKNGVGCFSQPLAVICDVDFLRTLPERERANGMGEIIKYGAIADPSILSGISSETPDGELVAKCVGIKRSFVEADEFDRGERHILNFGHTFGHAIEEESKYSVPHGQAVAYGMLAMAALGTALGVTESGVYGKIEASVEAAGLFADWRGYAERALPFLMRDKKSDGTAIDAVLLKKLGEPVRMRLTPYDLARFGEFFDRIGV